MIIPYRPSSGTEGADFMDRWCVKCRLEKDALVAFDEGCRIASDTMIFNIDDPEYPAEWRQDGPSGPRCTAFIPIDSEDIPIDPEAVIRPLL